MLFRLSGKKKVEKVKQVPRIWKFPRDKAVELITAQNIFAVDKWNGLKRFNYYSALADAGFDGFGHGKWVYRFGARDKWPDVYGNTGDVGFPCPHLEEKLDETLEG